ncbi:MAG: alpha/beta fold hydrolase [Salinibacter sp.]
MRDPNLNAEVRGPSAGASLLLLHGWGRSLQDMRPLAQDLSDTYRTHALDLPGHGASPPPPEPWGVAEHAQAVHEYIQNEAGERVTIIGHSNGGRIALYMASRSAFASVIERLVLISPSGVEPERSWTYHLRSGLATLLKAPVQALPAPVQAPAEDWLRHSLVWHLLGSSDYNAQEGVMRETFVKTVNYHLNGELRRIDAPTLLFWGTEDEAISRRQMKIMEKRIDDCGLVELAGAGHFGHLDQPESVNSGIRHFLENS